MSLCIVEPEDRAISETFIRMHAERLPSPVTVVSGWVPRIGQRPLLSSRFLARAWRKCWRLVGRRQWEWEITLAYIKAFRHSKARAVLAEYGPTGVRVLDACRRLKLPLVVHFHGCDASMRSILEENKQAYPLLFQSAAAIIVVSLAMEKRILSLGAPVERVFYNPYGVDCKHFAGGCPERAGPVFLAVGRFVEKKGPHLTLLAFARVARQFPLARLRMIGDGPLLGVCRGLAKSLGVDHAVVFLGAQQHAVVQSEMRNARAFVQHSVEASNGDCEGTPVAVLEAGATGLPVIATRHAGIPDVIREKETGFLVDEYDTRGMAAYMAQLIQDPGLAARLGRNARSHIEDKFSSERSLARLWSIIEGCSLVKVRGRTRPAQDCVVRHECTQIALDGTKVSQ